MLFSTATLWPFLLVYLWCLCFTNWSSHHYGSPKFLLSFLFHMFLSSDIQRCFSALGLFSVILDPTFRKTVISYLILTFYGPFTMLLLFYLISNTGLWPRTMLFSHLISFLSDKIILNETLWLIWHPINNSRGFLNLHFSLKILGGKMHILKKEKKSCLY